MTCNLDNMQLNRLAKQQANASGDSHGNLSGKGSSPEDNSPDKPGEIPGDFSPELGSTHDSILKKNQSQREVTSPKHYKTEDKPNTKSMFGRVLECQDDTDIELRDPKHVHHHEHHLYMEDHTNLQHEDAKELYGSPKNSKDGDKLKGLGGDTSPDDVWLKGRAPTPDYKKFMKTETMAENNNRIHRGDSRIQSTQDEDFEEEITHEVQALCEIKSFFIAQKINYALADERHRENYILREGTLAFVERYPYIRANHHSGLYKMINSEWGKSFFCKYLQGFPMRLFLTRFGWETVTMQVFCSKN